MTEPAPWDDVVTAAFRTTIDRAARGVATLDERALLRTYAEALLAELGRHATDRRKDDTIRDLHAALSRMRNIPRTPPLPDPDSSQGIFYTGGWQAALAAVETELVDTPTAETAPAGLREQYAAALRTRLAQVHAPGAQLEPEALVDYIGCTEYDLADAVLAVRDRRMQQLAAGRATWKTKAEEIERDRDRHANAIARVRRACDSVTAADQGHNPAVGWVVMRVLEAIDARLVHNAGPSIADCRADDRAHWDDKYDQPRP